MSSLGATYEVASSGRANLVPASSFTTALRSASATSSNKSSDDATTTGPSIFAKTRSNTSHPSARGLSARRLDLELRGRRLFRRGKIRVARHATQHELFDLDEHLAALVRDDD